MSLKEYILTQLASNKNTYISGSRLSECFNVSRNAIWKAINSLKNEGYNIESTKLGYKLDYDNSLPFAEGIRLSLNKELKDIDIEIHKSLNSTNQYAATLNPNKFNNKAVIIALSQTEGRGRFGRSFASPLNLGLYISFLLNDKAMSLTTESTIIAAVSLYLTIKEFTNREVSIKWVNDIFIDNKKACGILTQAWSNFESGEIERLIIGMGINIDSNYLPEELHSTATGIDNPDLDKNYFIATLINNFFMVSNMNFDDTLNIYKSNCFVIGKDITYEKDGHFHQGKAIDIDKKGHLIIKENNQTAIINSGEISLQNIF